MGDQCGVLDLNRNYGRSIWRAGPQPRSCEANMVCRTSTAIMGDQYGVLDLNRDHARPIWSAGRQPQLWEASVVCRIKCQKECQKIYWKKGQIESHKKNRKNIKRYIKKNIRKNIKRYIKKNIKKNIKKYIKKNNK